VDSWGLGCFWQELFRGAPLSCMDYLRGVSVLPPLVVKDYQQLLASTPSRRLNPAKCLQTNEYFQNKLVDTIGFLEHLALKDSEEKDAFFKRLAPIISKMCTPIAVHKMLPLLANALEYGSAPAIALTPYLQIAKTLRDDEVVSKVVPTLAKLFSSPDRALRVQLLINLESFAHHISAPVMEKQVWPHVEKGYTDSTAYVRELTLKSTLFMVPKLSQGILNQQLLKYLSKLQVDEEQAIRANTTICLGNIARYLTEATCKRVLLNAFTRALRDTFPPTRAAALVTLVATAQYYDPTEAAQRIIPAVGPLTIDADVDVRQNAFKCVECFVTFLKRYSDRVEKGENTAAPLAEAHPSAGLLSWAVTSLASRIGGKPKDAAEAKDQEKLEKHVAEETIVDSKGSTASLCSNFSVESTNPASPGTIHCEDKSSPVKIRNNLDDDDNEGWGDDLEFEDQLAAEADEAAARSRLASRSQATSSTTSKTKSKAHNDDGWGELDVEASSPAHSSPVHPSPAAVKPASTTINKTSSDPTKSVAKKAGIPRAGAPARPAKTSIGVGKSMTEKKVSKLGASKITKNASAEEFDWGSFLDE